MLNAKNRSIMSTVRLAMQRRSVVCACSGVTRLQWARVQIFQKGPLFPQKTFKKQRRANFGPPQRWARVHCTPCTPYCYATVCVSKSKTYRNEITARYLPTAAAAAAAACDCGCITFTDVLLRAVSYDYETSG